MYLAGTGVQSRNTASGGYREGAKWLGKPREGRARGQGWLPSSPGEKLTRIFCFP